MLCLVFFALAINELKNILQKSVMIVYLYLFCNIKYCIFVVSKYFKYTL